MTSKISIRMDSSSDHAWNPLNKITVIEWFYNELPSTEPKQNPDQRYEIVPVYSQDFALWNSAEDTRKYSEFTTIQGYKGYIVIKKEFQECKGEYKYKPIHNRLLTLGQANRVATGEKLYITITSRYGMVSDIITENELKQRLPNEGSDSYEWKQEILNALKNNDIECL